jgi:hypothetical protein
VLDLDVVGVTFERLSRAMQSCCERDSADGQFAFARDTNHLADAFLTVA